MPRVFINLEAGCLKVNLMSTSAQINQLKYTILYYTIDICYACGSADHQENARPTKRSIGSVVKTAPPPVVSQHVCVGHKGKVNFTCEVHLVILK